MSDGIAFQRTVLCDSLSLSLSLASTANYPIGFSLSSGIPFQPTILCTPLFLVRQQLTVCYALLCAIGLCNGSIYHPPRFTLSCDMAADLLLRTTLCNGFAFLPIHCASLCLVI
jgi:hypothetical protein